MFIARWFVLCCLKSEGYIKQTANPARVTSTLTEFAEVFDLRPGAIIRDLDLRRPIYRQTASYGHFGRDDLDLPWELTDKVDGLLAAANQ